MARKHLVVLETASTGCGHRVFQSAKELSVDVTFLCKDPRQYQRIKECAPYLSADGVKTVVVDTSDYSKVLAALKSEKVDGIYSVSDRTAEVASRIAEHYDLPFISPTAVDTFRNKDKTMKLCQHAGIPAPKTRTIATPECINAAMLELGAPVVVKRSKGTGSTDVVLCETQDEVLSASAAVTSRLADGEHLLLQQYIPGPLISVESFTMDGQTRVVGVTDRILGKPPHFVEVALSFPVDLGYVVDKTLEDCVCNIMRLLNVQHAVCHTEFVISKDGPVLIEVNPRIAGLHVGDSISYCLGINIFTEMMKLFLGDAPCIPSCSSRSMMEYHIYSEVAGRLKSIGGLDRARLLPGIDRIDQFSYAGDWIEPPVDYRGKKIATVIATGDTSDVCKMNCFQALSSITVDIAPSAAEQM